MVSKRDRELLEYIADADPEMADFLSRTPLREVKVTTPVLDVPTTPTTSTQDRDRDRDRDDKKKKITSKKTVKPEHANVLNEINRQLAEKAEPPISSWEELEDRLAGNRPDVLPNNLPSSKTSAVARGTTYRNIIKERDRLINEQDTIYAKELAKAQAAPTLESIYESQVGIDQYAGTTGPGQRVVPDTDVRPEHAHLLREINRQLENKGEPPISSWEELEDRRDSIDKRPPVLEKIPYLSSLAGRKETYTNMVQQRDLLINQQNTIYAEELSKAQDQAQIRSDQRIPETEAERQQRVEAQIQAAIDKVAADSRTDYWNLPVTAYQPPLGTTIPLMDPNVTRIDSQGNILGDPAVIGQQQIQTYADPRGPASFQRGYDPDDPTRPFLSAAQRDQIAGNWEGYRPSSFADIDLIEESGVGLTIPDLTFFGSPAYDEARIKLETMMAEQAAAAAAARQNINQGRLPMGGAEGTTGGAGGPSGPVIPAGPAGSGGPSGPVIPGGPGGPGGPGITDDPNIPKGEVFKTWDEYLDSLKPDPTDGGGPPTDDGGSPTDDGGPPIVGGGPPVVGGGPPLIDTTLTTTDDLTAAFNALKTAATRMLNTPIGQDVRLDLAGLISHSEFLLPDQIALLQSIQQSIIQSRTQGMDTRMTEQQMRSNELSLVDTQLNMHQRQVQMEANLAEADRQFELSKARLSMDVAQAEAENRQVSDRLVFDYQQAASDRDLANQRLALEQQQFGFQQYQTEADIAEAERQYALQRYESETQRSIAQEQLQQQKQKADRDFQVASERLNFDISQARLTGRQADDRLVFDYQQAAQRAQEANQQLQLQQYQLEVSQPFNVAARSLLGGGPAPTMTPVTAPTMGQIPTQPTRPDPFANVGITPGTGPQSPATPPSGVNLPQMPGGTSLPPMPWVPSASSPTQIDPYAAFLQVLPTDITEMERNIFFDPDTGILRETPLVSFGGELPFDRPKTVEEFKQAFQNLIGKGMNPVDAARSLGMNLNQLNQMSSALMPTPTQSTGFNFATGGQAVAPEQLSALGFKIPETAEFGKAQNIREFFPETGMPTVAALNKLPSIAQQTLGAIGESVGQSPSDLLQAARAITPTTTTGTGLMDRTISRLKNNQTGRN